MDDQTSYKPGAKNTLLSIILVLLILISSAMIYNFYVMQYDVCEKNIPRCVGSADLKLGTTTLSKSPISSASSISSKATTIRQSYTDGSYSPELKAAIMEKAAQQKEQFTIDLARSTADAAKSDPAKPNAQIKSDQLTKSDKPQNGITKFCIYHMEGCPHCHDIMSIPQPNGMTMFQELRTRFKGRPNIQILDFKSGEDREASKYRAFPVLMIVTPDQSVEYERARTVDGMARFIEQYSNSTNSMN